MEICSAIVGLARRFPRTFFVVWLLFQPGFEAQAQQPLSLCTEEALRTAVAVGGSYLLACDTNPAVTLALTRPLVVERDLSLVSTQEVLLNGQSLTRLFVVKPGVRLTLDHVLIFSGRQSPTNAFTGGIDDTAGAGIYNEGGIVTVLNSRFEANSVLGVTGADGGAGTSDDGESGGDAAGGAIYNFGGQVMVSNTVFVANMVTPGTGGAGGSGSGGFGGNGGDGGMGGSSGGAAIYSQGGSVTILASLFTNNVAVGAAGGIGGAPAGFLGFPGQPGEAGDGVGGAVAGAGAQIVISASTFVTNTVIGANGLGGNAGLQNKNGDRGLDGGEGAGGAVYSTGSLAMTNCTFFGNAATGGDGGTGGAAGSSGFGADGGNGGNGAAGSGGAVESTGSTTIINCTFSDNLATGGTAGTGGAGAGLGRVGKSGNSGAALGAAVNGAGSAVFLANSILANSTPTLSGKITDLGGNLSTDRTGLLTAESSLRLANPLLRPLANNGGPTPTMALATNSPAVDRAFALYCPPTDQRGTNRLVCDIGAYEIYVVDTNIPLPPIPGDVFSTGFSLARAGNLLELSWPAGYTNLFAQFKTNLLMTNWVTLTNAAVVTNNASYVLAVNLTNTTRSQAFFRLIGITNLANTNLLFNSVPAETNQVPAPF